MNSPQAVGLADRGNGWFAGESDVPQNFWDNSYTAPELFQVHLDLSDL